MKPWVLIDFNAEARDKAMAIYHQNYLGITFLLGGSDGILPLVKEYGFAEIDGEIEKYEQPIFSSAIGDDRFFWESVKVEFNKLFRHLDKPN